MYKLTGTVRIDKMRFSSHSNVQKNGNFREVNGTECSNTSQYSIVTSRAVVKVKERIRGAPGVGSPTARVRLSRVSDPDLEILLYLAYLSVTELFW